jgi:adenylosuccinate lyase
MNRFDTVSPLDYRYYGDTPEIFNSLQPYVSEAADIKYLIRVELALVRVLARYGVCSVSVVTEVEEACSTITPDEVYEEERVVRHNIRAIVNVIRKRISPASRPYVHLFATSNDIMDTAYALRYKELVERVLLPELISLQAVLIKWARENKDQLQIGRTHGQHAVPTTFGYAVAWFVSRLGSRIVAIDKAHRNLRGKFSGAVGAFNALSLLNGQEPALIEAELLASLGLKPSDTSVSTQLVEPEFLTDLVYAVVSTFSVLANLADDIRNLVRTEIGELEDRYGEKEVGSSTMPHKVNPKNFENVKSLWKEFMPRMNTVFMDQISEHQRDLTNSASLRFVPEIFTAFCYASYRLRTGIAELETNPARMISNFDMTRNKIVAEPLYILLALYGHTDAYDRVMSLSREATRRVVPVLDLVKADRKLSDYLEKMSPEHRAVLEDTSRYVGDAANRTTATCDYWEAYSSELLSRLEKGVQHCESRDAASEVMQSDMPVSTS